MALFDRFRGSLTPEEQRARKALAKLSKIETRKATIGVQHWQTGRTVACNTHVNAKGEDWRAKR